MTLRLTTQHMQAIKRHGEETYPRECCGFLLGKSGAEGATIGDIIAAGNTREDADQRNRYLIDPAEFMRTEKAARARGLDIVGVYHSHPDVEAIPSDFDREHAWPWYTYLIISVRKGAAAEARAWILKDDRSQFTEEKIILSHE